MSLHNVKPSTTFLIRNYFVADCVAHRSCEPAKTDNLGHPGKAQAVAQADNKVGTSQVFYDDTRSLEELMKNHYVGVESNDEDVGGVVEAPGPALE